MIIVTITPRHYGEYKTLKEHLRKLKRKLPTKKNKYLINCIEWRLLEFTNEQIKEFEDYEFTLRHKQYDKQIVYQLIEQGNKEREQ